MSEELKRDRHNIALLEAHFFPSAVKCDCVGQFGPNPDCGQCGGDGTYEITNKAWNRRAGEAG